MTLAHLIRRSPNRLAVIGLVISITPGSFLIAMGGMTLGLVGVTAARAVFWTIPTRFLTGAAAAGGLAFINMIGTTGGFFGPYLMGWLKDETGSYQAGLLAMGASWWWRQGWRLRCGW